MKKTTYLLTVIGLSLFILSCKKENKEQPRLYKFSEKSKLDWNDFKGHYSYIDQYDAALSSGVHYEYKTKNENGFLSIDFDVYAFFSQENSWTRYKEDVPDLLEHEQFHFYISELHARKLRKLLQESAYTKDYEHEIFSHYCFNDAFLTVMQHSYDDESNHSLVHEEQEKWEKIVLSQMKELEKYNNEKFTVKTNVPYSDI